MFAVGQHLRQLKFLSIHGNTNITDMGMDSVARVSATMIDDVDVVTVMMVARLVHCVLLCRGVRKWTPWMSMAARTSVAELSQT